MLIKGKKSLLRLSIFLLSLYFLSNLIYAETTLSQPNNIYNLGDIISLNIKLIGPLDGIFQAHLKCDDGSEKIFYVEYINLQQGKELPLLKPIKVIENKGNCYIEAFINNQSIQTSNFIISDKIIVVSDLDKEYLYPGDEIEISGNAIKENSEFVNGFVEVYLGEILLKKLDITQGVIKEKILLPLNLSQYEYDLDIKVYDAEKLNFGESIKKIYIISKASIIDINVSSIIPGENLSIFASVYDQNGNNIITNISVIVDSPSKKEFFKKETSSNKEIVFELPSNAEIGDWKIMAYSENLYNSKHFFVDKNEKISTIIQDGIAIIKNIGNTPINKVIEIEIQNDTKKFLENVLVNLDLGDEQRLRISAPSGEYDLGFGNNMIGGVILTGQTVSVEKLSTFSFKNPIFIIVSLIALFFILNLFIGNILKHEMRNIGQIFSKEVETRHYVEQKLDLSEREKKKIQSIFERYVDKQTVNKIIQTRNLKGEKKEVTALFVDIRGFTELTKRLGDDIIPLLNKYFKVVIDAVYSQGGVVNHIEADEVFALFNAVNTTNNHPEKAVRAAIRIMQDLNRLAEKGEMKLEVGIGINTGNAIVGEIGSDKIVKFTSIGDAINLAQKIEEKAKNKIYVTKAVADRIPNLLTKRIAVFNFGEKNVEVFEIMF